MFENDAIPDLLHQTRSIAIIGVSDKVHRASYGVAQYLLGTAYQLYWVNPQLKELWGQPVFASLSDLPVVVDLVNVFRRSEHLPDIVEEAIQAQARGIWTQLGVVDDAAAQKARDAGLKVVQDRCLKIEHARLN